MTRIVKGVYSARISGTMEDILAAQEFRSQRFAGADQGLDCDHFDNLCRHVLVEDMQTGALVACFRFLFFDDGRALEKSYAAQFYDLNRLQTYEKPMLEIGRFCIDTSRNDPDILRICWALLTRYVDLFGVGMMFGCASFKGTTMVPYRDAFALLKHRHLAPFRWNPEPRAPHHIPYAQELAEMRPDLKAASRTMPALLRSYLAMGGWVSDHAVIDHQLGTLHVLTAVEIAAIPVARKRFLRVDAA